MNKKINIETDMAVSTNKGIKDKEYKHIFEWLLIFLQN